MIVYIMCGSIGSGKTHVANKLFSNIHRKYNPDVIVEGESTKEKRNEAWDTIHKWMKDDLEKGRTFLVDSSQALQISRRRITQFIREVDSSVEIVCVYVRTDWNTCVARNEKRDRVVPEETLREYWTNISDNPPSREDGFDQIIVVDNSNYEGNSGEVWTTEESWPENWYYDHA